MTQVDFYDKEQVDDLLEGKADATSVGAETDQESETGSLWSRVKYVLGHWMTKDTEQTVTGKKIFSGGAEVPTSPATAASAVNSVYVNDATEGVNNLVHKSGNERITGIKSCSDLCYVTPNTKNVLSGIVGWKRIFACELSTPGVENVSGIHFHLGINSADIRIDSEFDLHMNYNKNDIYAFCEISSNSASITNQNFKAALNIQDNTLEFFIHTTGTYQNWFIYNIIITEAGFPVYDITDKLTIVSGTESAVSEPIVGATYSHVKTPSYFNYHNGVIQ